MKLHQNIAQSNRKNIYTTRKSKISFTNRHLFLNIANNNKSLVFSKLVIGAQNLIQIKKYFLRTEYLKHLICNFIKAKNKEANLRFLEDLFLRVYVDIINIKKTI